jgi:hypothetical protein
MPTPDYPLDSSTRFTVATRNAITRLRGSDAIHGLVISPQTGDVTNDALAGPISSIKRDQILELAYSDVIDKKIDQLQLAIARLESRLGVIGNSVQGVSSALEELRSRQDGIIELLDGVTVPNWRTREEVESGDDMGMVTPSAESIGLLVEFHMLQREPGFAHEDVVRIVPTPGSLLRRGSTVQVSLNLEG